MMEGSAEANRIGFQSEDDSLNPAFDFTDPHYVNVDPANYDLSFAPSPIYAGQGDSQPPIEDVPYPEQYASPSENDASFPPAPLATSHAPDHNPMRSPTFTTMYSATDSGNYHDHHHQQQNHRHHQPATAPQPPPPPPPPLSQLLMSHGPVSPPTGMVYAQVTPPVQQAASDVGSEVSNEAEAEDQRRRNKAASTRFRYKKREQSQAMEDQLRENTVKAQALEERLKELGNENRFLKGLLLDKHATKK